MDKITRKHPVCMRCRQPYRSDLESPQVPMLLSCGHVMCKQCVDEEGENETLKLDKGEAKGVKCFKGCGMCLHKGAQVHSDMVEDVAHSTFDANSLMCEECEDRRAIWWCSTCDTSLCKECFEVVHAPKVMRKHSPVPVNERPLPAEMCPHHPTEPLSLFCNSHSAKICRTCSETTHSGEGHNVVSLELAASAAVDGIKAQLLKLNAKRERAKGTARTLQYMIGGMEPSLETAEEKIRQEIAQLKETLLEALEVQEVRLIKECRKLRNDKKKALEEQNEQVMRGLGNVTHVRELCRDLLMSKPVRVLDAQPYFASKLGGSLSICAGLAHDPCVTQGVPVSFRKDLADRMTHQITGFGAIGDPHPLPKITATQSSEVAATNPGNSVHHQHLRKSRTEHRIRRSRSITNDSRRSATPAP